MSNFTQTAPLIKIYLVDKDQESRIKKYKLLDNMAWEGMHIRNQAIRNCIYYWQSKQNGIEIKDKFGVFLRNNRKDELKYLNGDLVNNMERQVYSKFQKELKQYLCGQKTWPLYKDRSLYIHGYTPASASKNNKGNGSIITKINEKEFTLEPMGWKKLGLIFGFVNVYKDKNIITILERIISGEYKFSDSKIIKKDKFWYLHLSYSFEKDTFQYFDEDKICGVDLGWKIPAVCGLNTGFGRAYIGDSAQLQRFKTQIKFRRRKLQKNRNEMLAGHGKTRSLKALNSLKTKEHDFVLTFNHTISKNIIDFCLKYNTGIIHLERLTREVKKSKFLTEYWSYAQLQQMIEYKAKKEGITVKYINPAYTSQMCSNPNCGHVDKDNRKTQSGFECLKCGYKLNADYNASVNIARSTNYKLSSVLDEDDMADKAAIV